MNAPTSKTPETDALKAEVERRTKDLPYGQKLFQMVGELSIFASSLEMRLRAAELKLQYSVPRSRIDAIELELQAAEEKSRDIGHRAFEEITTLERKLVAAELRAKLIRAQTVESAKRACSELHDKYWALYKHGAGPERADPHYQGMADGCEECERAIKLPYDYNDACDNVSSRVPNLSLSELDVQKVIEDAASHRRQVDEHIRKGEALDDQQDAARSASSDGERKT